MSAFTEKYRKLAINVALLFAGTAVSTALSLIATTPKDDIKAFVIAVVTGAVIAGARAAYGFVALNIPKVPTVPTDV